MNKEQIEEYFTRLKSSGLLPNTEQCREFLEAHELGELLNGN